MAVASEISTVRLNTNQPNNVAPFTDEELGGLIDEFGISGASARIWSQLAASYATKVDVTEAGASHKFSDLFKNASAMAKYWSEIEASEIAAATAHPRVNPIVRT